MDWLQFYIPGTRYHFFCCGLVTVLYPRYQVSLILLWTGYSSIPQVPGITYSVTVLYPKCQVSLILLWTGYSSIPQVPGITYSAVDWLQFYTPGTRYHLFCCGLVTVLYPRYQVSLILLWTSYSSIPQVPGITYSAVDWLQFYTPGTRYHLFCCGLVTVLYPRYQVSLFCCELVTVLYPWYQVSLILLWTGYSSIPQVPGITYSAVDWLQFYTPGTRYHLFCCGLVTVLYPRYQASLILLWTGYSSIPQVPGITYSVVDWLQFYTPGTRYHLFCCGLVTVLYPRYQVSLILLRTSYSSISQVPGTMYHLFCNGLVQFYTPEVSLTLVCTKSSTELTSLDNSGSPAGRYRLIASADLSPVALRRAFRYTKPSTPATISRTTITNNSTRYCNRQGWGRRKGVEEEGCGRRG